ncbi:MAG: sodium:solute symporter, partial [Lachnospiraceae bacterium]|nr:sodium:solute symporter [Lachnospiraceae bacterium]
KLSEIESDVALTFGQKGAFTSFFGPDLPNLIGVVILTSLGTWGLPQMVHKFYAIKDEKAIRYGTIISTFFAFVVAGGCYFLGGFGRLFDSPAIYAENGSIVYDSIIPTMLASLSDMLIGIVIVLVLSASMSTLSSLVLTSSSTLTLDFIKGNVVKDMDDKKQLSCMRLMLVFFIVISVIIALDPPTFIAQLMSISWGALAGAFLAPFMYGLYWKGVTKASVWASFATGVLLTVLNMFFKFIASPINAGAIAMVAGMIVVPLVSFVTPKMDEAKLNDMFVCLEEKVLVSKRKSIEE